MRNMQEHYLSSAPIMDDNEIRLRWLYSDHCDREKFSSLFSEDDEARVIMSYEEWLQRIDSTILSKAHFPTYQTIFGPVVQQKE